MREKDCGPGNHYKANPICQACGFDTSAPEYHGTSVTCSICKTVSDNIAIFCHRCGYLLNPQEYQELIRGVFDNGSQ